jgi:hypothetical protein
MLSARTPVRTSLIVIPDIFVSTVDISLFMNVRLFVDPKTLRREDGSNYSRQTFCCPTRSVFKIVSLP